MEDRTAKKIWYLKNLRLLTGMPEEFLTLVERITLMKDIEPRTIVYTPDEAKEKIYLLKKGEISIYRLVNGKKVVIDVLGPGDIFGDIHPSAKNVTRLHESGDTIQSSSYENFAETSTGCTICIAQKEDFFELMGRYPNMSMRIIEELSRRLSDAEGKIRDLALHNVMMRMVNELTRMGKRHGRITDTEVVIERKTTHEQLASLIGSTRETVTKAFSELKSRGIVEIRNGAYVIHRDRIPTTPNSGM